MAFSSNWHAVKLQGLKKILAQKAAPKVPNGQVYSIFARSPQPAYSEKVQRRDQGKFFKNRPKS